METVEILGYVGALFIGLILGLIGGGGSIVTVPILVYALTLNPVVATAYSLFVVGTTSLVGAIKNMLNGMVEFKTAFLFALPAFLTVYSTRRFLIPAVPETIFSIGSFEITKSIAIMGFFAIVMIFSSLRMIKSTPENETPKNASSQKIGSFILYGIAIGFVTGAVGAGGGFLIVPALVLFAKLPMKKAVATSLLVIAINSLIGFLGDVQNLEIDWPFLLTFTSISVAGIFMGIWLNKFIDGKKLKKAFGWFVLVMGFYIMYKEFTN